jgi:hypothetical protein
MQIYCPVRSRMTVSSGIGAEKKKFLPVLSCTCDEEVKEEKSI